MSRNHAAKLQAVFNQALAAHRAGQLDKAARMYREAVSLDNKQPAPLHLLGVIEGQRGNLAEGIICLETAIKLDPDVADAWLNLGRMRGELGEYEGAERDLRKSMSLNPMNPLAYSNLAIVLRRLRRHDEALACIDQSLRLSPGDVSALVNKGNILQDLQQYEAALISYQRALEIEPDTDFLAGQLHHIKAQLCDWTRFAADRAACINAANQGKAVGSPFDMMATVDDPKLQLKFAADFAKSNMSSPGRLLKAEARRRKPLRIGYLSPDFREHPVSYLTAGIFEHHDRTEFEIFAFASGKADDSPMRKRLEAAFDHFIDIDQASDAAAAQRVLAEGIDVLVDLACHTTGNRLNVLSYRPAPVQMSFLGHPGTTGAAVVDYFIADRTVVPESDQKFYSEKIVWLPDVFQPNDDKRPAADIAATRTDFGLPTGGIVFCCFNNSYKITPDVFDVWMRLLHQVENSVLWLLEGNSSVARANLCKEAGARGIAADRLIFAPRLNYADYLTRYRLADLFLDTLNFNGHTTVSDALWAGLPVITRQGQTFASRGASSLLRAVGLPELVTTSLEDYEALALKLARDPVLLAAIKARLAANRLTAPLFDTRRYTRHLEAAYIAMYERALRGAKPESFAVAPILGG